MYNLFLFCAGAETILPDLPQDLILRPRLPGATSFSKKGGRAPMQRFMNKKSRSISEAASLS